jgi:MFS family permease
MNREVRHIINGDHIVTTAIPARLDRLPWSRWHWRIVAALGITWILDGLEVTIVGTLSPRLTQANTLHFSAAEVGAIATFYIAGSVIGALVFGYFTDRMGRKTLFLVTLSWYTVFTVLTAFAWNFWSFAIFRFLTGNGIGGEYAAINSAIDELIPARRRGWTDLSINSSYWIGTMLGSALSLLFLDERLFAADLGWRLCFAIGAVIAIAVAWVRRSIPESPRWLMTRGRLDEADGIVSRIEEEVAREKGKLPAPTGTVVTVDLDRRVSYLDVARTMLSAYPSRTFLSLSLMVTQAFLYNSIFFTEALVLTQYFGVPSATVGLYIFPFAIGNVLGPWLLGSLFDTIGRKAMIAFTYIVSGVLLTLTGLLFVNGALNATTITICWSVVFFFASAGASSAYLTTSEIFPMEIRANAIAYVYAVGTLVGGALAPYLFGLLIQTRTSSAVFLGYLVGAFLMILGGITEIFFGVDSERRSLENVAAPLTAVSVEDTGPSAGGRFIPT